MLLSTFCHIPGISYSTENKLWNRGITSWHDLLEKSNSVPRVSSYDIVVALEQSFDALDTTPGYFTKNLKSGDAWRIFNHFRDKIAYLDIETTGLAQGSEITTIALYNGSEVKTYVNGINLERFLDDIDDIGVFVTYNGISFDIPFIERQFGISLSQAQIDLRYILARLGCKGGLKGCEKEFGINRGNLEGVDGSFAVALWHQYHTYSNDAALETLLAYNIEDTVNLERLMVEAYNRNIEKMPFAHNSPLPCPEPPRLDYHSDPDIIRQIRQQYRC